MCIRRSVLSVPGTETAGTRQRHVSGSVWRPEVDSLGSGYCDTASNTSIQSKVPDTPVYPLLRESLSCQASQSLCARCTTPVMSAVPASTDPWVYFRLAQTAESSCTSRHATCFHQPLQFLRDRRGTRSLFSSSTFARHRGPSVINQPLFLHCNCRDILPVYCCIIQLASVDKPIHR